jgi:MAF protein
MLKLVLGSTSPFRRALLEKLGMPFAVDPPRTDESPDVGESPAALVQRLAELKARDVGARHDGALVIGSDQVACIDGRILGKPGGREQAIEQLGASSGKTVIFYTGLCLLNTASGEFQSTVEPFAVRFRILTPRQIENYVDLEQPFDCAGSFKAEGLGITLFESMNGRDPNTLVGLPLICLVDMLANEGVILPRLP